MDVDANDAISILIGRQQKMHVCYSFVIYLVNGVMVHIHLLLDGQSE